MPRINILNGSGAYQDPWHPFPETSARLRDVLTQIPGTEVTVTTDVDATLTALDSNTSLLVLNIGNAGPGTPNADARTQLTRWLGSGGALLAVHVAATAFPDWEEWEQLLGGRWVRGTTFHPPKAEGTVALRASHPAAVGLADFTINDEFYTDLRFHKHVHVIAEHTWDGKHHPLAWTTTFADGRVAYVALGHDTDAYDRAEFRELLLQTTRWLLEPSREG